MSVANPFPLGAPIRPESRQIGRGPAIGALHRQVVELGQHTLLLAERRVGKTSMAWAVLDRIRDGEARWAIELDLSRGPVTTSARLADRLAEQARAAKIRVEPNHRWIVDRLQGAAALGRPALRAAAVLLGEDAASDAATVADSIDQLLAVADGEQADLRAVLRALRAAAIIADRRTVIFLDEAQRLATDWSDEDDSLYAQEALAEVMEDPNGHVVLMLAGSERSAIEHLFAVGRPLHQNGMTFDVPDISNSDWQHGLAARFDEVGLSIDAAAVSQVLTASGGHPQRTMRVCAHVHQLADGAHFEISDVLVEHAIAAAKAHPSWTE